MSETLSGETATYETSFTSSQNQDLGGVVVTFCQDSGTIGDENCEVPDGLNLTDQLQNFNQGDIDLSSYEVSLSRHASSGSGNNTVVLTPEIIDTGVDHSSWVELQAETLTESANDTALFKASNGNVYWAYGSRDTTARMYRSIDNGQSWQLVSDITTGSMIFNIYIDEGDSGEIFWAIRSQQTAYLYHSTNNGSSWSQKSTISVHSGTAFLNDEFMRASNGTLFWSLGAFERARIYRSTNNGSSWSLSADISIPTGCCSFVRGVDLTEAINGNIIWAFTTHGGASYSHIYTYLSTNNGSSWSKVQEIYPAADNPDQLALFTATNGSIYRATSARGYIGWGYSHFTRLYRSTNNGSSWSIVSQLNVSASRNSSIIEASNGDLFWSYIIDNAVYVRRSTNNGGTWSQVGSQTESTNVIDTKIYSLSNGDILWQYSTQNESKIRISTNGGSSWGHATSISGFGARRTSFVELDNESLYWSLNSGNTAYLYGVSSESFDVISFNNNSSIAYSHVGITNPSSTGTFYARIMTYDDPNEALAYSLSDIGDVAQASSVELETVNFTEHSIDFEPMESISAAALRIEYCDGQGEPSDDCDPPNELDLSEFELDSQSGVNGFIEDQSQSDAQNAVVTRSTPLSLPGNEMMNFTLAVPLPNLESSQDSYIRVYAYDDNDISNANETLIASTFRSLNSVSLNVSDFRARATGVEHIITAESSTSQPFAAMTIEYCSNNAVPASFCEAPVGLNASQIDTSDITVSFNGVEEAVTAVSAQQNTFRFLISEPIQLDAEDEIRVAVDGLANPFDTNSIYHMRAYTYRATVGNPTTNNSDGGQAGGTSSGTGFSFNQSPDSFNLLGARSLMLSSAQPSATDVNYQWEFELQNAGTLGSIAIEICGNDPILGNDCEPAVGFDATNHTNPTLNIDGQPIDLDSTSGNAIAVSATLDDVEPVAAETPVVLTLENVQNPESLGTFYARVYTYTDQSMDYETSALAAGGIAVSTAESITIESKVQENLTFCIFTADLTDPSDYEACTQATPDIVMLGDSNGVLSITDPSITKDPKYNITTNATQGATIRIKGSTLTAGSFQVDPVGDTSPGDGVAQASSPGTEQFGFCTYTDPNSVDTGLAAVAPYDDPNCAGVTSGQGSNIDNNALFAFDEGSMNSIYGAPIAFKPAGEWSTGRLAFLANIANTTEPGVYEAAFELIVTGRY